jgi:uncharacterized protein (TIGR03084 family)
MVDIAEVLADLQAESDDLDAMVADLSEVDFVRPTPSPGWTIAHQIAHLAWTDRISVIAVTDPDAFMMLMAGAAEDLAGFIDRGAVEGIAPPAGLVRRWREGRAELTDALKTANGRIVWFDASMSPASMATARIMETWAHGQDVADALSIVRQPTARLRHIAHLGARTMANGFLAHGRPAPTEPVRVELTVPEGPLWTFGPPDAANRLVGPAVDFAMLVTQRRHPADLALQASGPVAAAWLEVAQAFVGPPGAGRQPSGGSAR